MSATGGAWSGEEEKHKGKKRKNVPALSPDFSGIPLFSSSLG